MTETMTTCPKCEGSGKLDITVSQTGVPDHTVTLDCVYCTNGQMTPDQLHAHQRMQDMWCRCEPPGDAIFVPDGADAEIGKHHYDCSQCGGVLQIG